MIANVPCVEFVAAHYCCGTPRASARQDFLCKRRPPYLLIRSRRQTLRVDAEMAPKYHPTPLSGGDRKALQKEFVKARAMTTIPAVAAALDPYALTGCQLRPAYSGLCEQHTR